MLLHTHTADIVIDSIYLLFQLVRSL